MPSRSVVCCRHWRQARPGPFGLSDPDATRVVLEAAGFERVELDDFAAQFRMGADADDAVTMAREHQRGPLAPGGARRQGERAGTRTHCRDAMAAHDTGSGVVLDSRAWVITALR